MKVLTIIGLLLLISCKSKPKTASAFNLLVGEWKMEGKDTYEKWYMEDETLKGFGYELVDGVKKTTEELSLEQSKDDVFYIAKVLNQNDARPVRFKLNPSYKDRWVFENLSHDFPKRIIYQMINGEHIQIRLEGSPGHFLTYKLIRL